MLTIGDLEGRQDIVESSLTLIAGDSRPRIGVVFACLILRQRWPGSSEHRFAFHKRKFYRIGL